MLVLALTVQKYKRGKHFDHQARRLAALPIKIENNGQYMTGIISVTAIKDCRTSILCANERRARVKVASRHHGRPPSYAPARYIIYDTES